MVKKCTTLNKIPKTKSRRSPNVRPRSRRNIVLGLVKSPLPSIFGASEPQRSSNKFKAFGRKLAKWPIATAAARPLIA